MVAIKIYNTNNANNKITIRKEAAPIGRRTKYID